MSLISTDNLKLIIIFLFRSFNPFILIHSFVYLLTLLSLIGTYSVSISFHFSILRSLYVLYLFMSLGLLFRHLFDLIRITISFDHR